jgi:hypothetical protein
MLGAKAAAAAAVAAAAVAAEGLGAVFEHGEGWCLFCEA